MNIESEKQHILEFVDKGNYHAAYNIALSDMNACRKHENQSGVNEFIDVIKSIVDALESDFRH